MQGHHKLEHGMTDWPLFSAFDGGIGVGEVTWESRERERTKAARRKSSFKRIPPSFALVGFYIFGEESAARQGD